MPSETFVHTATFGAPLTEAWVVLQQPETWASIGGVDSVTNAEHDSEGNLVAYRFSASVAGKRYPGHSTVELSRPPAHMVVKIDTSELLGSIGVRLGDSELGGWVEVDLTVRSRSLLSGMMFPLIAASIGSGFGDRVDAFAARLSST